MSMTRVLILCRRGVEDMVWMRQRFVMMLAGIMIPLRMAVVMWNAGHRCSMAIVMCGVMVVAMAWMGLVMLGMWLRSCWVV